MRSHAQRVQIAVACSQPNKPPPCSRRTLLGVAAPPLLGISYGSTDAGTIVNSVLGAYGLPQVSQTISWAAYDDFDNEYVFGTCLPLPRQRTECPTNTEYPKQGWVRRTNTLRQGIVISNFQTADKCVVEVFPEDARAKADLAYTAVQRVMYPGVEIGGNSKLELPPRDRVKSEEVVLDGQVCSMIGSHITYGVGTALHVPGVYERHADTQRVPDTQEECGSRDRQAWGVFCVVCERTQRPV